MARHGPTEGGKGTHENRNCQGNRNRLIGVVGYSDDDEESCIYDNSHIDASGIIFDGGHKSAPTPRGPGQ